MPCLLCTLDISTKECFTFPWLLSFNSQYTHRFKIFIRDGNLLQISSPSLAVTVQMTGTSSFPWKAIPEPQNTQCLHVNKDKPEHEKLKAYFSRERKGITLVRGWDNGCTTWRCPMASGRINSHNDSTVQQPKRETNIVISLFEMGYGNVTWIHKAN